MTDTPDDKTSEQKLMQFLKDEKITLTPVITSIDPAGRGRFLLDIGFTIT